MRVQALMTLLSLALVPSAATQDPAEESTDAAVAEIERLFAATFEAYKTGDPAAVGALAVDDVDFVTSNAIWWRGREELQKGLAVVLPAFGQITAEMWPRVEKIRLMTHDVAVVHDGGGRGGARATQVVVRDAGQWRLVAQHGTRAAATPGFGLPGIRSLAADQPTLVSTWSAQSQPAESREEDEESIRGVVAASTEAFNNKDSSAYAARFVEDADFVTANAYWWRGREEIEKGIQVVLNGPLPSKHVSEQVEKIRFLAPDVALVHAWVEAGNYTLPTQYPALPIVLGGRTTRIVAKLDNDWRVVAYHGSNAAVPPPALRERLPGILRPGDGGEGRGQ